MYYTWSDKAIKDTVVNRTCHSLNRGSLEIRFPIPFSVLFSADIECEVGYTCEYKENLKSFLIFSKKISNLNFKKSTVGICFLSSWKISLKTENKTVKCFLKQIFNDFNGIFSVTKTKHYLIIIWRRSLHNSITSKLD